MWKDKLGTNALGKFYVPGVIIPNQMNINGQIIDIRQNKKDTSHSYLWNPSLKTVLGGIPVSTGGHL